MTSRKRALIDSDDDSSDGDDLEEVRDIDFFKFMIYCNVH